MFINKKLSCNLRIFFFFIGLFLNFGGSFETIDEVHAQESKSLNNLSLKEFSKLLLLNSLEIQLVQYDHAINQTKRQRAQSVFDAVLKAEASLHDNQRKKTTTLLGTQSRLNDYNLAVSKKFSSGTTLGVDMTNNRNWTNSSFSNSHLTHDSALGVTIKQDLGRNFFGIRDRSQINITQKEIESSYHTSLDKIEVALAHGQKTYWDLVLAQKNKIIVKELLSQAHILYQHYQEKIKDGLNELGDYSAAEANLKNREAELIVAEHQIKNKGSILKLWLNIDDVSEDMEVSDTFVLNPVHQSLSESLQVAMINRRDYKKAQSDLAAKKISVTLNQNSVWPEINLKGSFYRNGLGDHFPQAVRDISREDNPDFYTGLSVQWPLENNEAQSNLEKTKLEKAQQLVQLKLLERKIVIGIHDRLRDAQVKFQTAMSRAEIAVLNKKKLDEENKRYLAGRSSMDLIIRYQEDWLRAQQLAEQAQFDYQVAMIDLQVEQATLLTQYWSPDEVFLK